MNVFDRIECAINLTSKFSDDNTLFYYKYIYQN